MFKQQNLPLAVEAEVGVYGLMTNFLVPSSCSLPILALPIHKGKKKVKKFAKSEIRFDTVSVTSLQK